VKRDFDLIVYGATGYTGRLIAEYLATPSHGDDAQSWAIAGRSTDKLQKVRAEIGAPDDLPLIKADAAEPASLRSMCERSAVIITTVGPYQLHGHDRHPSRRGETDRRAHRLLLASSLVLRRSRSREFPNKLLRTGNLTRDKLRLNICCFLQAGGQGEFSRVFKAGLQAFL
jgi:hypothetical protein